MNGWVRNTIKVLYFVFLYSFLFLVYGLLQEIYLESCTYRAGLISMFVNLPVCNHLLVILQFVGDHFIGMVIAFTTFTLAMVR